jgi:hypothetical protein
MVMVRRTSIIKRNEADGSLQKCAHIYIGGALTYVDLNRLYCFRINGKIFGFRPKAH